MSREQKLAASKDFLTGGGEIGAIDWSQTPLGSVSEWTPSLKGAIAILSNSCQPMFACWGPEHACLYNEACIPIFGGEKQVRYLAYLDRDCRADIWEAIAPFIDRVWTTKAASHCEDLPLLIERGYLQETYYSFSYSPLLDENGEVGGVFCTGNETTGKIIAHRRLQTLREISAKATGAETVEAAWTLAIESLSKNPGDIPFALLYRLKAKGTQASLVGTAGIEFETSASPQLIDLTAKTDKWNLQRVARTGNKELIEDLTARFDRLPMGVGKEPPSKAAIIPITRADKQIAGFLVIGISPHLAFDEDYREFLDLVASNIANQIAIAAACEARSSVVCPAEEARLAELEPEDENVSIAAKRESEYRQEAETAKENLEHILNSIDDMFLALDREWRYTYLNNRTLAATGKKKEDLLGQKIWDIFPDTVGSRFYDQLHRALARQEALRFDYFYPGWGCWFENRVYPSERGVSIFATDVTARKRTEEALQESEEKLRLFVQYAPVSVAMFDRTMRYVRVSQRWIDTFNLGSIEAVLGKSHYDIFPEITQRWREIHQRCLAGAVDKCDEECFERMDGLQQWVRWEIRPWKDSTGGIGGITIFCEDISDRKQLEITLLQSEQRYRSLIEATAQIIWNTVPEGDFVTEQPAWSAFTGQTFEELKGWGWLAAIHPDDRERTTNAWLAALANRSLYQVEYRLRRYDGVYRHMSARAVAVYEKDGTIREWIGIHTDITDRMAVDVALQESEDRLRLALESAKVGTWDWNVKTSKVKWDKNSRVIFGAPSQSEVDYEVFRSILHPEDLDRTQQAVSQALDPKLKGDYDIEYRTIGLEDGVERWVAARGKAYFNALGEAVRFIGTVLDITDRKLIATERERLLEREQAAREQAETANRIKDEFLAVLSHELRTPLNPILGWTMLLLQGKLNQEQQKQALTTIERNVKLQVQLIEDLLDISRIIRGKMSLHKAPVEAISIIESALETVRLSAEAKGIEVEKIFSANVGRVFGDSTRLQQVIWNLLTNAVKFTPSGGRIEIYADRVGDRVRIRVKDTGKGIDAHFIPHVFDYFRQEDSKTTRKFGGLGLGLALVKYITELHGGTVWAESPGESKGATFTVVFPIIKDKEREKAIDATPSSSFSVSLQGVSVLVVDDEADIRDLVALILEQAGAEVKIAASAFEALILLEKSLPSLLVCDLGMPDMDGYDLIQQIRKQGGQIPAIALSAYAAEIDRQKALNAGFQRHVSKPVEPENLLEVIATLLSTDTDK